MVSLPVDVADARVSCFSTFDEYRFLRFGDTAGQHTGIMKLNPHDMFTVLIQCLARASQTACNQHVIMAIEVSWEM
jgi:hypothetical protein